MRRLIAAAAALVVAGTPLLSGCGEDTAAVGASDTPGTPPSQDPTEGADVAPAFRAFARGGRPPAMADQVDLYLGNAFTGFVTRQAATDRRAWETCTELGSYKGISCPLSPLDPLRGAEVEYAERPHGHCLATYGPIPPDLRALDRTVIVPRAGSIDNCLENFAVQLFSNDEGELVAISLLLGEP